MMQGNTQLRRKPDIVTADMNGETVMLCIETGKYYNLGRVGGAIWALLEQETTFSQLVDALGDRYDVEREKCERESSAFIEVMAQRGLILADR